MLTLTFLVDGCSGCADLKLTLSASVCYVDFDLVLLSSDIRFRSFVFTLRLQPRCNEKESKESYPLQPVMLTVFNSVNGVLTFRGSVPLLDMADIIAHRSREFSRRRGPRVYSSGSRVKTNPSRMHLSLSSGILRIRDSRLHDRHGENDALTVKVRCILEPYKTRKVVESAIEEETQDESVERFLLASAVK